MKRFLLILAVSLLGGNALFATTEGVTDKWDVCITKIYSVDEGADESVLDAVDDKILEAFTGIERFDIIGMQFDLDSESADLLIESVRTLKEEAVFNSGDYIDEDLGIAVVPAAELEQLANAFFVIVPEISKYDYSETAVVKTNYVTNYTSNWVDVQPGSTGTSQGGTVDNRPAPKGQQAPRPNSGSTQPNSATQPNQPAQPQKVLELEIKSIETNVVYGTAYYLALTFEMKMISAEGTLLDTLSKSGTYSYTAWGDSTYVLDTDAAVLSICSTALYGLEDYVRGLDEFKLRSVVHDVRFSEVLMELGTEMGVETGWEFVVTRETTTSTGFTFSEELGLVRIKDPMEGASYAGIAFGHIKEGDVLVETVNKDEEFVVSLSGLYLLSYFGGISFDTPIGFDANISFDHFFGYSGFWFPEFGLRLYDLGSTGGIYGGLGWGANKFSRGVDYGIKLSAGIGYDVFSDTESATDGYAKALFTMSFQKKQGFRFNLFAGGTALYFAENNGNSTVAFGPTAGMEFVFRF